MTRVTGGANQPI